MSTEAYKALIRQWVEEVWNQGKLERADELMSPDYVLHIQGGPETLTTPEGFKQLCATYRGAIPDVHTTIEDLVGEGDRVVWRFTMRGTHLGELPGGIAPTGKPVSFGGVVISRFAEGRWVEDWPIWDALTMLQQIGVVPTPDQEMAGARA
jgi:steroid delta-isomerase-like uncharacterized protein